MWQIYLQPTSLDEALRMLAEYSSRARIVAGGTDVVVELRRGVRPTEALIDISMLRELKYVRADGPYIRLGGLATHNDVLASEGCIKRALPLAQACIEVGAPQISHTWHHRRESRHRLAGQRHNHTVDSDWRRAIAGEPLRRAQHTAQRVSTSACGAQPSDQTNLCVKSASLLCATISAASSSSLGYGVRRRFL
ncbi:MAG: hypothetical protein KatS3mg057_0213 [Herpetosiphonaceae bacterium]|nr:MAG: hypothetical protein KatS3mg057_0213 [Herpetosiphonaceae bacterium]